MNELPRLAIQGNRIVRADTQERAVLRGINRSGLEYSQRAIPSAELDAMIVDWGANVIRVPFNQSWALGSASYLNLLDSAIEDASARGAYTILDLQWLDNVTGRGTLADGSTNYVPPLPNEETVELWSLLSRRCAGNTSVLFDIFNEPHDPLPDDPLRGEIPGGRVGMAQWQPWALRCIEAIRSADPDVLVLVPGTNWAYDLRGFPLDGVENAVYSTHVYPGKGTEWDACFGDLADTCPVIAGEFGGTDNDLPWGRQLLDYFRSKNMGWLAWSWCDYPRLTSSDTDFHPTAFGELVRAELATEA